MYTSFWGKISTEEDQAQPSMETILVTHNFQMAFFFKVAHLNDESTLKRFWDSFDVKCISQK